MKYKVFRAGASIDKNIRKHELVAVELGRNIEEVEDALMQAVTDDLIGAPEYEKCSAYAYAPEVVECCRGKSRYQYSMHGVVDPPLEKACSLVEYGIMEESE